MFYFLGYILIGLGFAGFILASYIHSKKQAKKKLVCPMKGKANCDTVIHSDYSHILGIPVELLGMIYYAFIACAYIFVSVSGVWSHTIASILFGASVSAVFFSVYLVSLQAFVLKHWCAWCLGSAGISLIILIVSYLHLIVH